MGYTSPSGIILIITFLISYLLRLLSLYPKPEAVPIAPASSYKMTLVSRLLRGSQNQVRPEVGKGSRLIARIWVWGLEFVKV